VRSRDFFCGVGSNLLEKPMRWLLYYVDDRNPAAVEDKVRTGATVYADSKEEAVTALIVKNSLPLEDRKHIKIISSVPI
jgi:hypothetical protein